MRVRRALITALSTIAIGTIGITTSASAGAQPTFGVDVSYTCNDSDQALITVDVSGPDGDTYDIYIDDELEGENTTLVTEAGPYLDGFISVVVRNFDTDAQVYSWVLPAACFEPLVGIDTDCDDNGDAYLQVLIADVDDFTYYVSVDGAPIADMQLIPDTGEKYADVGVFPAGEHTLTVVWAQDLQDRDYLFREAIILSNCNLNTDDSGSGAGIPPTGGGTSLALIAGLFVAAGGALLVTRRLRTA